MKVIRERPSRRRHHRVTAPLNVRLGQGEPVQAADWSLGGLRIDGYPVEGLEPGADVRLNLELPFQGFEIGFSVEARVMRTDADSRSVAFEFVDLSERAHDIMNHFIEDLIRGQMATFDDAICRIDIPVTPISTQPDPNPVSQVPVRRWPIKTAAMAAFYVVLGLSVFGYLGVLLYSGLMRMEITAAVVSAPLQTVRMPTDGVLAPVRFEEGLAFKRGDVLARIDDARLSRQISEAELKVSEARRSLWRTEQKHRIERERVKLYQIISKTDRDMALAKRAARRAALQAADAAYERISRLHKEGFATAEKLSEAAYRRSQAAAQLKAVEAEIERSETMASVSHRRHYNHKEFVVDLDMLALDLDEHRSELQTAIQRLESLQEVRDRQIIRAPYDGRIVSVLHAAGGAVTRDQPLLVLEEAVPPTVTAFLTQEEVLKVGLGDSAKVFLPAVDQQVAARVIAVDRTSSYINTRQSQYTWQDGDRRTAAVKLSIDARRLRPGLTTGLPAIVIFSRRTNSDIYHRIAGAIAELVSDQTVRPKADDDQV